MSKINPDLAENAKQKKVVSLVKFKEKKAQKEKWALYQKIANSVKHLM